MAYTKAQIDKIFNEIINLIEQGDSLRSILLSLNMPSSRTFYKWIDESDDKVKRYARSCYLRSEILFDEIIDISDDNKRDRRTLKDGQEVVDHEVIARSRLRVDTRKWILSKMNPEKYGDKVDVTTKGDKVNRPETIKELQEKLNILNKELKG